MAACSCLSSRREVRNVDLAFEGRLGRTGEPDLLARAGPLNHESSTGHVHPDFLGERAVPAADGHRGASTRAAGLGFTDAALEDPESHVVRCQDLEEADVHPPWKSRV